MVKPNPQQAKSETTPLLHSQAYSPKKHYQGDPQKVSQEGPISPENDANIFSRWTFWWLNDLFRTGYRRQIQQDDLYEIIDRRKTAVLGQMLFDNWETEKKSAFAKNRKPSLLRAIVKSFWRRYLPALICLEITDMAMITNPSVMRLLLVFLQDTQTQNPPPPAYRGYILAFTILFVSTTLVLFALRWNISTIKVGIYMRTALVDLVFRKATTLSTKSHLLYPDGAIINLMSTDISRIDNAGLPLSILFSMPIFITLVMGILIYMMGPAALLGAVILMSLNPIQAWGTSKLAPVRKKASQFADARIKLSSEILQGIKVIKFYTWENSFLAKLAAIRSEELALIHRILLNRGLLITTSSAVPVFASALTFVLYAALGHELKPEIVFPALAYYAIIRVPLSIVPHCYTTVTDAYVAIKRLEEFLLSEDESLDTLSTIDETAEYALELRNANFVWETISNDKNDKLSQQETLPYLRNINLSIPRGSLTAIVGPVGSGKTSLLQAIIGTMTHLSGNIIRGGAISYASQTPWIQNATIRDNILFDQPFDEVLYRRVIRACCLAQDLESFPAGDMTEIGERGVNMSGGQKARLSLARGVYFNALSGSNGMVIMDDPLSAVDAHVGKRLWNDCMLKELKNQTRIIVTHQLHILTDVDYIVCMQDGAIVEKGTFQELMSKDRGALKEMMAHYSRMSESFDDQESIDEDVRGNKDSEINTIPDKDTQETQHRDIQEESDSSSSSAKLMTEEERESGAVSRNVYIQFFQMEGVRLWTAVVAFYFVQQCCGLIMNYWLSLWTDKKYELSTTTYMAIYMGLAACQFVLMAIATQLLSVAIIRTARKMHSQAFEKVIHAPLSFFDTNPLGRILNRFSKDVDALDNNLWMTLNDIVQTLLIVLGSVATVLIFFPYLIIMVLPMAGIYYFVSVYYRTTSRELKRFDSTLRSHLYSYFTESLTGMTTLKAYNRIDRAIKINQERMDLSNRPYYLFHVGTRWVSLRSQVLGATLLFVTTLFIVGARNSINAATAGLVLSYLARVGGDMNWVVQCFAAFEITMNSAERLVHYIKNLPQEPPAETSPHRQPPLSHDWPSQGSLEFKNVTLRYRPELPPVLRNVSFSVQAGHKLGVVGRTGAGKSSLIQALFLLSKLDPESQILLDGVDTQTIGTADLRSHIAIIPQDPVLFEGTFRYNLDPLERHSEQELWQVLETCNLKRYVQAQEGGLDAVVLAKGENLSVGQRQLVCLARALLSNCKIVVLDEATASVDLATDAFIQEAIRNDFAGATIVTIAHRINTIIDYDKILVMQRGQVAEYDSPQKLLENPSSIFSTLVNESG
ncbi:hypothetical protein FBU30_008582, partial [Linnemannia zychae]